MKKVVIAAMLAIVLGIQTVGADVLKGRVVDAETKEPLPEAQIELMQQVDYNGYTATWVMHSAADTLGCFNMNLRGRGTLSVSMLGYYSKQKVVLGFSEDTKDTIDVGDIALQNLFKFLRKTCSGIKEMLYLCSDKTISPNNAKREETYNPFAHGFTVVKPRG